MDEAPVPVCVTIVITSVPALCVTLVTEPPTNKVEPKYKCPESEQKYTVSASLVLNAI